MPGAPLAEGDVWQTLHVRADWQAARVALAAVESEDPPPPLPPLSKAICAGIAWNRAAISDLIARVATPDEPLILPPLLRGLAGTNQLDEADRILTDVAARQNLA